MSLKVVDASAEAQQQFGSVGEGTEIWRWLLAIAFIVIAVEFMLSTPSGRPAGGKDERRFRWLRRLRPGVWAEQWTGEHEAGGNCKIPDGIQNEGVRRREGNKYRLEELGCN